MESVAFGLGYTAVLIWGGSALNGSFGYADAYPYWYVIPLRTDTAGVLAFAVAIVCLVVSRYLHLRRSADELVGPAPTRPATRSAGVHLVQAMAETGVVLGTGLVIYLSLNAVTHPWTLKMQLTHLAPWPTEGTVRAIALGICLIGMATRRYLRATANRPGQATAPGQAAAAGQLDAGVGVGAGAGDVAGGA